MKESLWMPAEPGWLNGGVIPHSNQALPTAESTRRLCNKICQGFPRAHPDPPFLAPLSVCENPLVGVVGVSHAEVQQRKGLCRVTEGWRREWSCSGRGILLGRSSYVKRSVFPTFGWPRYRMLAVESPMAQQQFSRHAQTLYPQPQSVMAC
jgi:hypothetical protein